ncbi:hypothetical protein ACF3OB_06590 [Capnocytophaga canis]|uniref:hypothetical protein n=1 Tax=Capnocytophaga canis TaxID=1848903 RepID=UPI00370D35CD
MVDYFKTRISYSNPAKFKELVNNGTFAVATTETETATAEVTKETYLFKNMVIEPQTGGVLLYGSLHKFRSQIHNIATPEQIAKHGGFNGDLFTLDEITQTIDTLCEALDVCPSVCKLQNIEIGLNNPVSFDPKEFLTGILYHRNNYDYIVKHEGNYVQFDHNQYYLKLYNKSRQYQMDTHVIRVEIKVRKMQKLHTAGIELKTLEDINALTLSQTFEVLYKEFEELVYFDKTTRTHDLNDKGQAKAVLFQNKEYWRGLNKIQRGRKRKQLEKMVLEFSENLKGQIQSKMNEVFKQVLGTENTEMYTTLPTLESGKNVHNFTDPENTEMYTTLPTSEKGQMYTTLHFKYRVNWLQNAFSENGKNLVSENAKNEVENLDKKSTDFGLKNEVENSSKNEGKKTKKVCAVTGIELTHEKEGARYIRTATFLHLREHDPERYILLCSYLLPQTGYKPVREKNIIMHLCKQVRNLYNNPNKGKKTNKPPLQKHFKNQLELF